jgi:anthranilate synthase component 2
MTILLLDNYDSFTYNLLHYIGETDAEVDVARNDQITVDEIIARSPRGIVISPGPGAPDASGITLELVERVSGRIPILGVCLGHQAIGQAFGGKVVRAPEPVHGKVGQIHHTGESVFAGLPSPFDATRYHSLIVERETLPACLTITAETRDGIIMGLRHTQHNTHGVQFHPESIASQYGHELIRNFLGLL